MVFEAKKNIDRHRSHTVDEAIAEIVREQTVGLSINMTKNKRAAFKARTAENDTTMQEVLMKTINEYLKENI